VSVRGSDVHIHGRNIGFEHVDVRGARIAANGRALAPGTFLGAYGCFRRNKSFAATQITLSGSIADYPGRKSKIAVRHARPVRHVAAPAVAARKPELARAAPPRPAPPRPAPPRSAPLPAGTCGGYRWPVKIATDSAAQSIALSAVPATIAQLDAFPAPPASDAASRNGREMQTYRLTNVTLIGYYSEHDRDDHLVLSDGNGHTMIAEAPDPACAGTSTLEPQIARVRAAISGGGSRSNVPVTLEGPAFFDARSTSIGHQAPNGIELHPITAICFGTNCALP
jgi:hypothetical protein